MDQADRKEPPADPLRKGSGTLLGLCEIRDLFAACTLSCRKVLIYVTWHFGRTRNSTQPGSALSPNQPHIHPSSQPNISKYIVHKELLVSQKAMGQLSKLTGFFNMKDKMSSTLSLQSPWLKVHKRTKGLDTGVCSSKPNISELPQAISGSLKQKDSEVLFHMTKNSLVTPGTGVLQKSQWIPIS